jgi:hypothetical protein
MGEERETDGLIGFFPGLLQLLEELAVRVNGTSKGFREPVERDPVENCIKRRVLIRPFQEFLADPD